MSLIRVWQSCVGVLVVVVVGYSAAGLRHELRAFLWQLFSDLLRAVG